MVLEILIITMTEEEENWRVFGTSIEYTYTKDPRPRAILPKHTPVFLVSKHNKRTHLKTPTNKQSQNIQKKGAFTLLPTTNLPPNHKTQTSTINPHPRDVSIPFPPNPRFAKSQRPHPPLPAPHPQLYPLRIHTSNHTSLKPRTKQTK